MMAAFNAAAPLGNVLELACGPGTFTDELADPATSVTALDASPELEIAAARTAPRTNVRFSRADLFAWTPDRRYDLVFFGSWLSHVPAEQFASFRSCCPLCV